jgi:hypothetical protein
MKTYLVQAFSGEYHIYTVDGYNITYFFNPKRKRLIYLQSYNNVRSNRELVSQRIVTIKTKSPSGKVIATRDFTSDYVDRLRCMITADSKNLLFEQGLSFQSSRK